jgi:hypothetical protein
MLRRFRDQQLMPHRVGRLAVRAYYAAGPTLARWVVARPSTARLTRRALDRVRVQLERRQRRG